MTCSDVAELAIGHPHLHLNKVSAAQQVYQPHHRHNQGASCTSDPHAADAPFRIHVEMAYRAVAPQAQADCSFCGAGQVNSGSSSLKFKLFSAAEGLRARAGGLVERIGDTANSRIVTSLMGGSGEGSTGR